MSQHVAAPPRLTNTTEAARWVECTERTIRNWVGEGKIKGYRIRGKRQLLVDLDEVNAYANRRLDYGPKARIIELAARPEVVTDRASQ